MRLIRHIKNRFRHWIDSIRIERLSMSPNRFTQRERLVYRLLEMVPGAALWLTFLATIVLSFAKPLWAIVFILLYDIYWLLRLTLFIIFMVGARFKLRKESGRLWLDMLRKDYPDYREIYHVVLLPFWKEPYDVLKTTLESYAQSSYDLNRIIVVLAGEERNQAHCQSVQERITAEFEGVFDCILSTMHSLTPGELAGKSANATYAAKIVKEILDQRSIRYENVILSSFDSDTAVHKQYFACLSYHYLSNPNRLRASYQPLIVYNNNMWESVWFSRVVSNSTTFWQLSEFGRNNTSKLFTYSSHSMPFQMLVDVGFWEVDMVSEDSRIFLQAFLHYKGDYKVVPMYIPVYLDTVDVGSLRRTLKNQYLQVRRWGYGAEHVPYLVFHFFKEKQISWRKKFLYLFHFAGGTYGWATTPIMMIIMGRLPLAVLAHRNDLTIVLQRVPHVLELVMEIGMIGIIVSAIVNMTTLPAKPAQYSSWKYVAIAIQWITLPICLIVFGSIPAADSQTRLMLGKYLGFWNTEKIRRT